MKTKRFTKLFALLLAMVMLFSLPMEVSAAARKVTAATSWKKAKAVKTGKTTVTAKDTSSFYTYVKFTATKTKTYKIKFSNLRKPGSSSGKDIISASAHLSKVGKYGYLNNVQLTQNKKKTYSLNLCSSYSYKLHGVTKINYLTSTKSRTASIKLKKGETIYISFGFSAVGGKKCLYDLTIQ